MNYVGEKDDYHVLTPAEPIGGTTCHGTSGAPVLNQIGGLLGILCGGDSQNNAIFVLKMKAVISLIDTTLKIEEIETLNKK